MLYDSDGHEFAVAAPLADAAGAGTVGVGAGAGAAEAAAGAASAGDKRKRVAAGKAKVPSGSNFVSKQKQAALDAAAVAEAKKAEVKEQRRRLAYAADLATLKEENPRGDFEPLVAFQARFAVLVAALKRHQCQRCRATLPTIITAMPSLADLAARADVDGFLNEEEVLNIITAEGI